MKIKLFILLHIIFVFILAGCATNITDAIRMGDINRVQAIIGKDKTKINQSNNLGDIPLHLATYNDDFEIIKYLVEQGANVNAKGKSNDHARIEKGMTKILIDNSMSYKWVIGRENCGTMSM